MVILRAFGAPACPQGIILSDIGLEPFVDRLQGLLQALGETLFPGPGCAWDGHHCFIVRYREEEDLGLDMHTDDSETWLWWKTRLVVQRST